jgi:hypothetical protein
LNNITDSCYAVTTPYGSWQAPSRGVHGSGLIHATVTVMTEQPTSGWRCTYQGRAVQRIGGCVCKHTVLAAAVPVGLSQGT